MVVPVLNFGQKTFQGAMVNLYTFLRDLDSKLDEHVYSCYISCFFPLKLFTNIDLKLSFDFSPPPPPQYKASASIRKDDKATHLISFLWLDLADKIQHFHQSVISYFSLISTQFGILAIKSSL